MSSFLFRGKNNAFNRKDGDNMLMIQKPGYHIATVMEPLILEEADYKDEPRKWEYLKELCGFTTKDKVSRIVLNIESVEYWIEEF